MQKFRIEKDSIGEIQVPSNRLWGAQTQRALKYFHISNEIMPIEIIHALTIIKKIAAEVNSELSLLPMYKAQAIIEAANEILANKHIKEFPLTIWQTGSGTQTNMNVNEVIANRASEILGGDKGINSLIHPNDDVNKCQSSNDVFPSSMHIASVISLQKYLLPSLKRLQNTLQYKSYKFKNIIKIGRTHLQDAVPLTLGQEISGWASMLRHNKQHIKNSMFHLNELAIGGTAVGTGLNAHPKYANKMIKKITQITKHPFINAPNKFESIATCDAIVHAHGTIKGLASSLMKIANDIRWLSSGPRCGIGEIKIPNNEPGSSIMPGKVNPTQCEMITMICAQIMGNDVAINIGGSSGNFELNVFRPMIIYNFLQSVRLLSSGILNFNKFCVIGITPDRKRIKYLLEQSLLLVTILNNVIGYDKVAHIVNTAYQKNITIKESTIQLKYLTSEKFDQIVQAKNMINTTQY
uniref:Fumarate hydratase class II n=1 Tax=Candidatus Aschnera chinzeii TaxID=1485666 RepID=A0AAT9G4L9_9ENTR|nr:MAG: class II fumarate hydratase [Candidatus Aschnera chinzeii]